MDAARPSSYSIADTHDRCDGHVSHLPDGFDMDRLASGANVYFKSHGYGDVVDYAESLDGGLTTVQRSDHPVDGRVYTLLTNGKFQGDSSDDREMKAQVGFGLVPMFHSSQTNRGLVIGLGTGVTARALHDGGVKHVDIVELSGDLLRLAKTYFSKKNGVSSSDQMCRVT